MKSFAVLPFLGLLVAAYAIVALIDPEQGMSVFLGEKLFEIKNLPSTANDPLIVTTGDLFVTVGLFLLAVEILKATNTNFSSMMNHIFSVLVFVVAMGLFIAMPNFGTMTFFLITVMTLVDVMAMIVTIITARRDIGVPGLAG